MKASARAESARQSALALAGLTFSFVAPLTYLAERVMERMRAPVVNPGLILLSTHLGYVWRAVVATWFGAACAGLVYLAMREEDTSVAHATKVSAGIVAVGALLAVVALFFP